MNRYTQSFILLILCLAVAGAIGWYTTRDPSGTRGWNNESVAVGYIEPAIPVVPQKPICKTVDQQYVATWEKYRNSVYGYNYQYPKDASISGSYGSVGNAKSVDYDGGEFDVFFRYENEECQDSVAATIKAMPLSKLDLGVCGIIFEDRMGLYQLEKISLDKLPQNCYIMRGVDNALVMRLDTKSKQSLSPLEIYFKSSMVMDDSIGKIYNGWTVKSGSMEEGCSRLVMEGEKKFRGWYAKAVFYVGDPEWMFRIDDRDVAKLPIGFNNPSRSGEGYIVGLGDVDEAAEQKRLNTGPKNPITLTLREWRSYCEGRPSMSVKPSIER